MYSERRFLELLSQSTLFICDCNYRYRFFVPKFKFITVGLCTYGNENRALSGHGPHRPDGNDCTHFGLLAKVTLLIGIRF